MNCLVSVPRLVVTTLPAMVFSHQAATMFAATSRCFDGIDLYTSCMARKAATVPAMARTSPSPMTSMALLDTPRLLCQFVVHGICGAVCDTGPNISGGVVPLRQRRFAVSSYGNPPLPTLSEAGLENVTLPDCMS